MIQSRPKISYALQNLLYKEASIQCTFFIDADMQTLIKLWARLDDRNDKYVMVTSRMSQFDVFPFHLGLSEDI